MPERYLEEMAALLVSKGIGMDEATVRTALQEYWQDKLADVWTVNDVVEDYFDSATYKQTQLQLLKEEAINILQIAAEQYDADQGINHEKIKDAIYIFEFERRHKR